MSAEEIPETVKQLLSERIHSHEELEVVVLLHREGARLRTEDALAGALKIDIGLVGDSLNALRNRDIVESLTENATTYWRTSQTYESQLSQLVAVYDEHRLEIVMLMSANAIERVRTGAMRTFADCFFLGKKRNDG